MENTASNNIDIVIPRAWEFKRLTRRILMKSEYNYDYCQRFTNYFVIRLQFHFLAITHIFTAVDGDLCYQWMGISSCEANSLTLRHYLVIFLFCLSKNKEQTN